MAAKLPAKLQKIVDAIEKEELYAAKKVRPGSREMILGNMYIHVYDAKWKNTLEWWDAHPMWILLRKTGDRMHGINLNYIPWLWRKNLTKKFLKMASWGKRITYRDIKLAFQAGRVPLGYCALAYRTYLYSHIRSPIYMFDSNNYEYALDNLTAKWKKATEQKIFKTLLSRFYKKVGGIGKTSKS